MPLRLLVVLAAAGALALLTQPSPSRSATAAATAADPYHAPAVVDTNPDPTIVETTITAKRATVDVGNGVTARALTFNGAIPGPTFKLEVGDTVIVHFRNALDEVTGIHWHGIELANEMDGTPLTQNQVRPGDSFIYTFTVTRPGIYWYHPHHHSSTNQVFKGMYGMIVVRDPHEAALASKRLLPPPERTLPIVLSDTTVCKAPGSNDAQTYPSNLPHVSGKPLPVQAGPTPKDLCETSPLDAHGEPRGPFAAGDIPNIQQHGPLGVSNEGQTVLTNGVNVGFRSGSPASPGGVFPTAKRFPVRADQQVRLQLVNASTTRYMRLRMTDHNGKHCTLFRLGGEGGLLDKLRLEGSRNPGTGFDPGFDRGDIVLPPGGRADVLTWTRCGESFGDPAAEPGLYTLWTEDYLRSTSTFANTPSVPVMHFDVSPNPDRPNGIDFSELMVAGAPLRPANDPVERLLSTNTTPLEPSTLQPPKQGLASPAITLSQGPNGFSMNDVHGTHDAGGDVGDVPHLGSTRYVLPGQTLELTTSNQTGSRHPFHLHGFSIQPLALTKLGAPTFTWDYREFVDTVDIPAGYTLRYRVRIDPRPQAGDPSDTTGGEVGRWMMHCHIFFHAEQGMLSELVVLDGPAFRNERPTVGILGHEFTATRGRRVLMHGIFSDPDGDPVTIRPPVDAETGQPIGEITQQLGTSKGSFLWEYTVPANEHDRLIKVGARDTKFASSQILVHMDAVDPAPQPTPTPTPTPKPAPGGNEPGPDATAPVLTKLRAKRAGPHVAFRFKLSEPAAVTLIVKRGRRRIARLSGAATAGPNTLMLHKRLRRGRYQVIARATDLAGNAAPPVKLRLAVGRRASRSLAVSARTRSARVFFCALDARGRSAQPAAEPQRHRS
jgi:FtsP/CotA-like multicopper oxidase with cupredoxin domain